MELFSIFKVSLYNIYIKDMLPFTYINFFAHTFMYAHKYIDTQKHTKTRKNTLIDTQAHSHGCMNVLRHRHIHT